VLHHTLLVASSDDYDYDSSNGTEIEPGTQPSAPDQGYVADDDDLFTNATLFVLWCVRLYMDMHAWCTAICVLLLLDMPFQQARIPSRMLPAFIMYQGWRNYMF